MRGLGPLIYVCVVLLIVSIFKSVVFGGQEISLFPTCGPEASFNIVLKAKGFLPNSNVAWKLVGTKGNISLTGYYQTDSNGKINETTNIHDVEKGQYKFYIDDDRDNDGRFDLNSDTIYSNLTIPCQK